MSIRRKQFLALLLGLFLWPAVASAETITFTSTNSAGSYWWWDGNGTNLYGAILSGVATRDLTGQAVNISCGTCWVGWGTGVGNSNGLGGVSFVAQDSYVWIFGNDGAGNRILLLQGSFTNSTLTNTGQNQWLLSSQFSGTISPTLLALFGLSGNGPVNVSGLFTAALLGALDPNTGGSGWTNPGDPSSWGTGVLQVTVADDIAVATPEPGTLALFGTGLLGFAAIIRRKLVA